MEVREAILEMFGFVLTTIVEFIDERYVVVNEVAAVVAIATVGAVRLQARRKMQYRIISNTNPLKLDGVKDPIISMIWISDVEGILFMCLSGRTRRSIYPSTFYAWGVGLVEAGD